MSHTIDLLTDTALLLNKSKILVQSEFNLLSDTFSSLVANLRTWFAIVKSSFL